MAPFRLATLVALVTIVIGCASQRPIPREQEEAFFRCVGVSVDQAEANLAGAGYLIASSGPTYVQTDWAKVQEMAAVEAWTLALAGVHDFRVRISVTAAADGVRWRAFNRAQAQVQLAATNMENEYANLTEGQVGNDRVRAILNRLRRDTCGSDTDFFREVPPPTKTAERRTTTSSKRCRARPWDPGC